MVLVVAVVGSRGVFAEGGHEQAPSKEEAPTHGEAAVTAEEPAATLEAVPEDFDYEKEILGEDIDSNVPAEIENTDVVLLLDTSGSMLSTDPEKLRNEGAKLLLQFLKKGDRLGVIAFSDSAKVVRPLTDYSDDTEKETYKAIASLEATGEYTNIVTGVEAAKTMLEEDRREKSSQVIVLMSDGKMEPHPKAGTPEFISRILFDFYLPELKSKGIKIHTLAFSDQADKDLLKQIAAATDAASWFTPTAEKIHESYAELFLVVKKPQIVPFTSKGFRIDSDIKEVTFYINKDSAQGELSLVTPSGKKVSVVEPGFGTKWFSGKKFDVVTVMQPEPGNWQVNGLLQNDSFATAITNLRLITDFPQKTYSGEPITIKAQLFDGERPIVLPDMTGDIQYAFQVTPTDRVSEPIIREFLNDDGKDGDERARDGVFSARINLEEEGEYKLRIVARAPTFERNQQIPFRIRPPLLGLDVVTKPPPQGAHGEEGEGAAEGDIDWFRLRVSQDLSDLRDIKLRLIATDDKDKKFELPVGRVKSVAGQFETPTTLIPHLGTFEVRAFLNGVTKKGKVVTAKSRIVEYDHKEEAAGGEEIQLVGFKQPAEQPKSPSSLPYLILMTLVNGALGAMLIRKLSGAQKSVAFALPTFRSLSGIEEAITGLENLAGQTTIDISDPRLSDPNFKFKPALGAQAKQADSAEAAPADSGASDESSAGSQKSGEEVSEGSPSEDESSATQEEEPPA